jgi:hypothetical protein
MIAKDMGIEIPDDVVAEILVDIKKISEQKKKSVSRQEFKRILKAHGYEIPTN